MNRLSLVQLDSVEPIRAAASDWDRLWAKSEATLPTARAELVAQWLEHFAPNAKPHVLVVKQDDQMAAALPLVGHRRRGVLPVGDLTWNYWSPNGELLLDPAADAEAVLGLLADAIQKLPWPLLWLELVPFATARWETLFDALRQRGLGVHVQPHYEIGQVELAGSLADYEAARSRNLRRSLRKDRQRLEREGPVTWSLYSQFTPDEVQRRLRQAFEIEDSSWKHDAGQTVLRTPEMFEFYLRQTQQLAQWGSLRLAFLEHAGKPIAFELGWVVKGVYHSFKVGFDQTYRSFGPGHLLRQRLIESFFQQPDVQVVDFQGPLTDALAGWATRTYPIGRILVGLPTLTGRVLMAGYRLTAPIVRRLRGTPSDSPPAVVSLPDSRDQNPGGLTSLHPRILSPKLLPMTAPRAVVFDMDGLMFNTEDVYFQVGSELLRRRGCEFTRELSDAMMGRPPQPSFEVMIQWHSLTDTWQTLVVESEELFIGLLDELLAPMPGLLDLLNRLEAAGIPKAICTSSSRRVLTAVLSRFDMEPRFQFTLTAQDIVRGKPDPEIYQKAAQRLGLKPHEMLVLEDSQAGCCAAASAGAFAVAVPGAHSARQDFSVASLVINSLADPRLYEVLELKP